MTTEHRICNTFDAVHTDGVSMRKAFAITADIEGVEIGDVVQALRAREEALEEDES